MSSDISPSNVIARYEPRFGGFNFVILISGLLMVGFIANSLLNQRGGDMIVTITMACFLAFGIAAFVIIFSSIKVRAIEATAAGTMDFVSRIKRDSQPRSALVRIEGFTTRSSKGSVTHRARFVFVGGDQKEILKDIVLPGKGDPALHEFVRQLEKLNSRVDTSIFWAWDKGTKSPPRTAA